MATEDVNAVTHDLSALLSSNGRDYLIRNNGDKVDISSLNGKIVGLYFAQLLCDDCRRFTPKLVQVYNELIASNKHFEVVYVPSDIYEYHFNKNFSEMPWLALPFYDPVNMLCLGPRDNYNHCLYKLFKVNRNNMPKLVIIDSNGKVSTENGASIVEDYGVDAYPFSSERIDFLKEQEEEAKRNQTLTSILVSSSQNYLLSNDGNQVPVSELEGMTVGLFFSVFYDDPLFTEFTTMFEEFYKQLKGKGEKFEMVLICLNPEEEDFNKGLETIPWLALPFEHRIIRKLLRFFGPPTTGGLVIIGPNGKTLCSDATEMVVKYGSDAYPFTPESLAETEKARQESQTLESLLVSGDDGFVIGKNGSKVPVSELVGKKIILYFGRAIADRLINAYKKIKEKGDAFVLIFIWPRSGVLYFQKFLSRCKKFFSTMPLFVLPYKCSRMRFLQLIFDVKRTPTAIAIGRSGRTVTKEVVRLVEGHGVKVLTFTEEQLKHLTEQEEENLKGWPEKLKHELHAEHELKLTDHERHYHCRSCDKRGIGWSFSCKECHFDLHPKCALDKVEEEGISGDDVRGLFEEAVCAARSEKQFK